MTDHSQHNHRATARIQFMGQFEPIVGIGYRFKYSSEEPIEGKTDDAGYTKTLIADNNIINANDESMSYIKMDSDTMPITLEVQRDDGSWKEIGDFQLEADKEKTITAQIETIVLPFKLELVKGL
ncbi:hypothetical protein [Entomomonas asaccharolytica]|uniref:Uncharacterized protein n=1 Tax=Entomomonas asaccharolytica TaxID=2785331 RepID=A0A974RY74_9GAMM|nr:hypothetical protein [Entomomonas asaccharolytica]QQP86887.1 hypothetical protein JHT90_06490 [Entomomonas asaccharolytica]